MENFLLREFFFLWFTSKSVFVKLRLEQRCLVPGQEIKPSVSIENYSNVGIKSLSLQLIRVSLMFQVSGHLEWLESCGETYVYKPLSFHMYQFLIIKTNFKKFYCNFFPHLESKFNIILIRAYVVRVSIRNSPSDLRYIY